MINIEEVRTAIREKLLDWLPQDTNEIDSKLEQMGFYEAPASAGHHLAEAGGLALHSLAVTQELMNLTDALGLEWQNEYSPIIVGLLHDLCKTDSYVMGEDGKYHYSDTLVRGHGIKSLIYATKMMGCLTDEEQACILYHMGAFSDDPKERSAYSDAVKRFPNVLYTHTADMIASQIKGI